MERSENQIVQQSVLKNHRYPGGRPFEINQQHIFFGRRKACQELHTLLHFAPLIVLYGKSGLGKSSLLNAGLFPIIKQNESFEPISIRFGSWTKGKRNTPRSLARAHLLEEGNHSTFLQKIYPDDQSLWYTLKIRQIIKPDSPPLLLVFDQFEELFTYPPKIIDEFGQQLSELLYLDMPQRIRKMAELFQNATPDFLSNEEQTLLYKPIKLKIILAIRSDRMSMLDLLTPKVPQILSQRYQLKALEEDEAKEAIVAPAQLEGNFSSPQFTYSKPALELILEYLTAKHTEAIESFQLQILCETIEQKVIGNELTEITEKELGNLELVFENYYENQISRLGNEEELLAARKLIEEGLIFEEEKQRLSLFEGQIFQDFDISPALLRKLVNTHLIRRESGARGSYTYELSHDTLITPILKAKKKRLQEEAERAAAEKARLAEEKHFIKLEIERKGRKRARRTAIIMGIGFWLSVVFAITTVVYAKKVKNTEKELATAYEKSVEQKNLLEGVMKEREILFGINESQKKELQKLVIKRLLEDAETFRLAEELDLEWKTLLKAYALDPNQPEVITQLSECEAKLRQE